MCELLALSMDQLADPRDNHDNYLLYPRSEQV